MTDSIAAGTNQFASAAGLDQEQTNFEPQAGNAAAQRTGRRLDLRDALEWLLGAPPHEEEVVELPQEERSARVNRRMDLLLWILNLEPRLAPYEE